MDQWIEVKMIEPNNVVTKKNTNNLSLSERDLLLMKIKDQIDNKKNLLIRKSKALEKKQKVNHFLENVKGDYEKYYNYIVNEKKQQYYAMSLVKQYLDDLIKIEKLTDSEIKKAKYDQKVILNELDKIKHELDEIIEL